MTQLATQLDFSIVDPGTHEWWTATARGISFKDGTPYEEWERAARTAAALYEGSYNTHVRAMFLLGDALDFGEHAFGEQYSQVIDQTRAAMRLNAKTIENAAWIARSVPPENRHDGLSFAHHEQVAKLELPDQARLLQRAEDEGLSVSALKKEVRTEFPPVAGKKSKKAKDATPDAGETPEKSAVQAACETLLIFFAPYIEGKKPTKLTDELKAEFHTPMQDIYKLARKFVRKGNW